MDTGESGGRGPGRGGGGGGGVSYGSSGGKIRTRRYHLAAASSKPYPRNKQGIINIVKESVKSIVPTWLQRYFKQNEEEASPTEQSNQEENVNYHSFADDITDNPLDIDGRITPEPTRISLEEPSTSRSGLNFTDILTRPSLHRSHLNCNVLDTPPLCQPSTSTAFPISNSGLSLGKEMKDSTSQHDDDNISTTSGFSSRASDKDIAVSKSASLPPLWSTEAERTISLSQHTATSSKKPGFNLSAFGALSPSLGNASVLKTSQLGNSPFYPGKTTYGGAAAARQSKVRITPYQTPIRRQMKAKQVNAQSYGVTSSTARRILQSLEKMSSPLADAKRIPSSVSSPLSPPMERSVASITDLHSLRKKVDSHYPPVQKLVTPKTISLSMSRSQYFKPSLTSTESGRIQQRIEMNHNELKEKNLAVQQQTEPSKSVSNPKFSTSASNGLPAATGSGGGGKMRREKGGGGGHYVSKTTQEAEEMETPKLPEISLPISSSSLPSFSFGPLASTPVSSSPVSVAHSVANKVQPGGNAASSPVFRFSSPIVKSTEAEVLPPVSIGDFKFSVPVAKSSELSGSKDTPVLPVINSAVNNVSSKRKTEEYDGPFKPAKTLKEGSVLDILKAPGFASPTTYSSAVSPPVKTNTVVYTRPAISSFSTAVSELRATSKQLSSSWQCEVCLGQNKVADHKCVACQAAKVPTSGGTKQTGTLTQTTTVKSAASATGTQGFGDRFKATAGTWDCDTCLVQNKPEATKCVACETPKPGTGVKSALVLPVVTENATTVSSSSGFTDITGTLGFGDKFKKPKGAWECSVCLVSNKAEDSKCVACQSDKPGASASMVSNSVSSPSSALSGGFLGLDQFKKPEGSWDCETCLVQNKVEATKCVACESAKPGSKAVLEGFGTGVSSSVLPAPSFKFGIQSSSTESPQVVGSAEKNVKFGKQAEFKFGIASESGLSTNSMAGGFKFTKMEVSKLGGFPPESKSENNVKDSKNNSGFNFGLPSGATNPSATGFQFGIANLGQQGKEEGLNKPVPGGFGLGTGSAASAIVSGNKTGISSFKFGTPEEKETAATPFKKPGAISLAKGGFAFQNVESVTAPQIVLGRTDETQESVAQSNQLVFEKKAEKEESKAQSIFSFGKAEQTKDESTVKAAFSFSLAQPAEKETDQQIKPAFSFGAQSNPADPGATKPTFSFLSSSSSTAAPSASAGGGSSVFSSSTTSASNSPAASFLFGQASNTVSSSAFGNPSDSSASQSFGFSQESKPPSTTTTTTNNNNTSTPVVPFLFGTTAATTNNPANSGFSFAATTTTTTSTGSSSSFVFGSGTSASTTGPAFGASQPPTFGQTQGAGQPPAPTFGSLSSSSSLFSTSSQSGPPAFGSVLSSSQPPVFGQPATQQPGFGSGTAPNSGPVFQFGSSPANFNFTGNSPGIFTFGGTPGAPAQPAGSSGFSFTQPSAFNPGNNGKNIFSASGSSLSGRKIKTAVRRRK